MREKIPYKPPMIHLKRFVEFANVDELLLALSQVPSSWSDYKCGRKVPKFLKSVYNSQLSHNSAIQATWDSNKQLFTPENSPTLTHNILIAAPLLAFFWLCAAATAY